MMVVNVHYSPGKMCHWPWLNVTWSSTQWSTEQNKPSLDGRSAECGSSPLQPHWQPLRVHLSSILSSQAPALVYAASLGQHSLTPCSQEDALSLTCRQGTACSLGGQQPVCQLEPQTCPNHRDRESSCSAASSRRCLPTPVWTSGTNMSELHQRGCHLSQHKRVREKEMMEALPANFIPHCIKAQQWALSKRWCSMAERAIAFQENSKNCSLV